MKKLTPQTLKGFRDFLPRQMIIRQKVINTLVQVFESYGFQPLETPALEYAETLLGKYGQEADRLVYTFKDRGQRQVGLRYDLTVPTARVLAQYRQQIPLPFKRYQIQPAWRAENPQKGRYRQFTQCDIDTFGSDSPLADAEIIALIYESLKKLGFKKFIIKINSRQVLFELMTGLGIKNKTRQLSLLQTIDKLSQQEKVKVEKELEQKGLKSNQIKKLFQLLGAAQPDPNLKEIFKLLPKLEVQKDFWRFDPTLARGLDYYTGPVFETIVEKPRIGSITGGGRYDNLIVQLGGPNIAATGTTIGLDRICDVIEELNLWPKLTPAFTQVLVTVFSEELLPTSIKASAVLRKAKINTELYPDSETKLDKQIKYADKKGIPWVMIVGPEEAAQKQVTLKNLKTTKQESISLTQAIKNITAS